MIAGSRVRPLLALLCLTAVSAQDPYDLWAQGRPAEAVPTLMAQATTWADWMDVGLAAAAAQDPGVAAAGLARAAVLAPTRPEPRSALRALGHPVPPSISERLGPLARPGVGWAALGTLGLGGAALGWGLARRRRWAVALGTVAVLLALPGQVATWLPGPTWVVPVRATTLLDHAGAALTPVPAGTLLERSPGAVWHGRVPVVLPDGRRGFLAQGDLLPE